MNFDTHLSADDISTLAAKLQLKTAAAHDFLEVALENVALFDAKQSDYGSRNISSFGTFGVVVRMNDKFERIKNLFSKRRKRPVNESIRDSFRDIANYALIAYMLETRQWPEE